MSNTTCPCCRLQLSPGPHTKEEVSQQMQCYQRALQEISSRFNSFSTIARLPDELLCRVFLLYADDHGVCKRNELSRYLPYGYLRIAQVCRYWRNIAMKCSRLWNCVHIGSARHGEIGIGTEWMVELLTRSGAAPLTVNARVSRMPEYEMLLMALREYHRIESLNILFRYPIPAVNIPLQKIPQETVNST
ncbi:hypothetical protein C8Q75DRAFT_100873 [Abortiporus biennis]|nr:hypothetical protein C8Q75DRAFT_100873 [Abortiporus biennis]